MLHALYNPFAVKFVFFVNYLLTHIYVQQSRPEICFFCYYICLSKPFCNLCQNNTASCDKSFRNDHYKYLKKGCFTFK